MSETNDVIDLTADSTENLEPEASSEAAASFQEFNGIIDLSNDNVPWETSGAPTQPAKKKRKRSRDLGCCGGGVPQSADVVDVEAILKTAATTASPPDSAEAYKQALGPIRMDFVTEFYPPHAFAKNAQNPNFSIQRIYQELLEYKLNLPVERSSSIFVRAMESRLDLLRVMITGPEDTPYAHGIFLFDCYLSDYPHSAPKVKFLTTGGNTIRFNPNLYACGKVCLSLLGTWSGPGWISNQSTLLQVLVSIQGLVLVPDPYFNEPGFDPKHAHMRVQSEGYNRNIRRYTLQYAIRDALQNVVAISSSQKKPYYPEFEAVVRKHFGAQIDAVRAQMQEWTVMDSSLSQLSAEIESLLMQVLEDDFEHIPKPPPQDTTPIEIL